MKILVTGGAGFIGAHLCQKLIKKQQKVIIVDNFNHYYDPELKKERVSNLLEEGSYTLYKADICEYSQIDMIFEKEKPDLVIHLAAMAGVRYSIENPLVYEKVNVKGTANLLELMKKHQIERLIYASSSSVYGGNKKLPFKESDQCDNPISPYAATKKATELLVNVYTEIYKLKATGLRFFTVYGPWGRPDMAYYKFIEKMTKNETIEVYNNGDMQREFTYIDDIIDGVMLLIDKEYRHKIFNIGGSQSYELMDFISILEKHSLLKAKKKMLGMQSGEVKKTLSDVTRLKKLGWKPKVDLNPGIKKFVDWYINYNKSKIE